MYALIVIYNIHHTLSPISSVSKKQFVKGKLLLVSFPKGRRYDPLNIPSSLLEHQKLFNVG